MDDIRFLEGGSFKGLMDGTRSLEGVWDALKGLTDGDVSLEGVWDGEGVLDIKEVSIIKGAFGEGVFKFEGVFTFEGVDIEGVLEVAFVDEGMLTSMEGFDIEGAGGFNRQDSEGIEGLRAGVFRVLALERTVEGVFRGLGVLRGSGVVSGGVRVGKSIAVKSVLPVAAIGELIGGLLGGKSVGGLLGRSVAAKGTTLLFDR